MKTLNYYCSSLFISHTFIVLSSELEINLSPLSEKTTLYTPF